MQRNVRKGDLVRVQSNGEVITRRVWDADDVHVFLCTEEAYQKATREGKHPLVGFAAKDEIQAI